MSIFSYRKLAIGAAAALAAICLSPDSAQAAAPCDRNLSPNSAPPFACRVTVEGLQYNVATFTGSYNNNQDFAQPPAGVMPWWGTERMAQQFAEQVGGGLGYILFNEVPSGPLFGFNVAFHGQRPLVSAARWSLGDALTHSMYPWVEGSGDFSVLPTVVYADQNYWWAQAYIVAPPDSVPSPLPLFGVGAAFGFSRKLRNRIQGSRRPLV